MKEKILAEIERLRKNLPWGGSASQLSMECDCKNEAYAEIEKFIKSLPEEPVSEDLKEAAINASFEDMKDRQIMEDSNEKRNLYSRIFRRGFKAGAQWQREQMMAKAVDGLVVCDNLTHGYKDILMEIPSYLNVDDEVKVIIIKED